jgi:osmotically-inducible protein OsmY
MSDDPFGPSEQEREEWHRMREREHEKYMSEKPWRPENQGVQTGDGTFGGMQYGGVVGMSAYGGGAEKYSITDPYANEWYVKKLRKQHHAGVGPSLYRRTDTRIREDICDRLADHSDIDARGIEVMVEDRVVTLTGNVSDRQSKWLAESIADDVFGVKDVRNHLSVSRKEEAA